MPSNRHKGRSASQVAFRKARAEMATLYNKGYHPNEIIRMIVHKLADELPGVCQPLLSDMSRAVLFLANRPGVPNLRDMKANRDFAACDGEKL